MEIIRPTNLLSFFLPLSLMSFDVQRNQSFIWFLIQFPFKSPASVLLGFTYRDISTGGCEFNCHPPRNNILLTQIDFRERRNRFFAQYWRKKTVFNHLNVNMPYTLATVGHRTSILPIHVYNYLHSVKNVEIFFNQFSFIWAEKSCSFNFFKNLILLGVSRLDRPSLDMSVCFPFPFVRKRETERG